LEALTNAPVGVTDQALELRERGLEVLALSLELLDVLDGLLILALGERVDRADPLAAALQALEAQLDLLALIARQRLVWRLGAEPARDPRQVGRRRLLAIPDLRHPHLFLGEKLGRLTQAGLEVVLGLRELS